MTTLGPLDAAFLRLETERTPVHIASVAIFAGPMPSRSALQLHMDARSRRIPRFRQLVRESPAHAGAPQWVDDAEFDIRDHLFWVAVPSPHGDRELHDLVGQIMSVPMDRDRPQWETWFVEGLAEDRWAVISKMHHSMVDGVGGLELLAATLDAQPHHGATPAAHPPTAGGGSPPREHHVHDHGGPVAGSVHRLVHAMHTVRGFGHFAALAKPAPEAFLVGRLGRRRGWATAALDLDKVNEVRRHSGGTVNDVVLAAATRAFRDLLLSRGTDPYEVSVRTLVPISIRRPEHHGSGDNHVTAMVLTLPVSQDSAVARLAAVQAESGRLKSSGEPQAGALFLDLAGHLPQGIVNAMMSAVFAVPQWFLTTVTTNVPGPTGSLSLCGRSMLALYPYVPIADRIRVGIAVTSYGGRLYVGVTTDLDHIGDPGPIVRSMTAELEDLLAAVPAAGG